MLDTDNSATSILPQLITLVLTVDKMGGSRRQNAENELQNAGLRGEFVEGYKKSDPLTSQEYSKIKNLIFSKRNLTAGEIAVYAGHRRIWRNFLQSGADVALIFEDDFEINNPDEFRPALEDCLSHKGEWGMVKFFDFKPKRIVRSNRIGNTSLVKYKYAASGAVAYLLNRDTAEKLLSRTKFFRPVDEDLSWSWELNLDIWSTDPNLVSEKSAELGGSLLESDRIANKKQDNVLRRIWDLFLQAYKQIMARISK